MQMPSSKIPSETRQRLLNSFVPIGERLFEHTDRLFNAGFKAFMPLYEDSIAGCDQDKIEFHQQFLVEAAKEEIGNGSQFGVVLWGAGTGYKSELLTQLRRSSDAEGYGRDYYFQHDSPDAEIWRCWLSPCWIERWRIGFQEPERDTRLLAIRNTRLKEEKAKETARICQIDWASTAGGTRARRAMAKRILSEALVEFGFSFRKDLSIPGWFVFSRPLRNGWELRFGVEIANHHQKTHIFACKNNLRRELLVWPSLYDPSEYVEILLDNTALEFLRTYNTFENDGELEVNLRAILFLYKLEHEFLTEVISKNI
jgi:hypothetical protein